MFSDEEVGIAKQLIDTELFQKSDDPSMVFENADSCSYLVPVKKKGTCTFSTLTNSFGCVQPKSMKDLISLIAIV